MTRARLPVQGLEETRVRSLGREDPREEGMAPTPVFLPGESHGQRSLVGYSLCSGKESATTKHTHTNYTHVIESLNEVYSKGALKFF